MSDFDRKWDECVSDLTEEDKPKKTISCADCHKTAPGPGIALLDEDVEWMAGILARKHRYKSMANRFLGNDVGPHSAAAKQLRVFRFCSEECMQNAIAICRLSSGV